MYLLLQLLRFFSTCCYGHHFCRFVVVLCLCGEWGVELGMQRSFYIAWKKKIKTTKRFCTHTQNQSKTHDIPKFAGSQSSSVGPTARLQRCSVCARLNINTFSFFSQHWSDSDIFRESVEQSEEVTVTNLIRDPEILGQWNHTHSGNRNSKAVPAIVVRLVSRKIEYEVFLNWIKRLKKQCNVFIVEHLTKREVICCWKQKHPHVEQTQSTSARSNAIFPSRSQWCIAADRVMLDIEILFFSDGML